MNVARASATGKASTTTRKLTVPNPSGPRGSWADPGSQGVRGRQPGPRGSCRWLCLTQMERAWSGILLTSVGVVTDRFMQYSTLLMVFFTIFESKVKDVHFVHIVHFVHSVPITIRLNDVITVDIYPLFIMLLLGTLNTFFIPLSSFFCLFINPQQLCKNAKWPNYNKGLENSKVFNNL